MLVSGSGGPVSVVKVLLSRIGWHGTRLFAYRLGYKSCVLPGVCSLYLLKQAILAILIYILVQD